MRDERSNPDPRATLRRPGVRRRSRADGRAQRRDAWPATTARDVAALRFLGEQYAVRVDVLAAVLGRLSQGEPRAAGWLGRRTLRQRLGRWEQAGWGSTVGCWIRCGCCRPRPGCAWPAWTSTSGTPRRRGLPTITRSRWCGGPRASPRRGRLGVRAGAVAAPRPREVASG
jgi:hypothetical protein